MTLLKSNLIFFKTLLFFLFDSLALWNVSPKQKNKFELVLLVRQDAIGDYILWLDTAKEYRKLFPPGKYKITLVGNSLWCGLAKELPYWDEVVQVDVKRFKTFSRYRWKLLRQVKHLGAVIAVQPTYSREYYQGDALVRASSAKRKISSVGDMSNRNQFKQILADNWYTELIPASPTLLTELERNAEFFSGFSRTSYLTRSPKLNIPESWLSLDWKDKLFYVFVPGASTVWKEWPTSFFANLAEKVHQQTGWGGIICGTQNEHVIAQQILNQCDVPLQNMAGQTELTDLAGLLSQSQLAISNDSGAAHISAAVGTPTVCISGGGHFGRFVPYPELPGQTNHLEVVYHKMPCYGCNWECVYTIKEGESAPCITNVSVDAVWEKVKPLLTS